MMGSLRHSPRLALLCALLATLAAAAVAKFVTVGEPGAGGYDYAWNPAANYSQWADKNPVAPGDVLVFLYPKRAEVVYRLARRKDLDACHLKDAQVLCDSAMGSRAGKGGAASACAVTVEAGEMYLASIKNHCAAGQRLVITTSAGSSGPSTGTPAAATQSVDPMDPLANANTPPPPSPRPSPPPPSSSSGSGGSSSGKSGSPPSSGPGSSGDSSGSGLSHVDGSGSATPPPSSSSSSSSDSGGGDRLATTAASARTVVVGYTTPTFNYPWNPQVKYDSWLAKTKIYSGDVVVFKFPAYHQEVVQFSKYADWQACNFRAAKVVCYDGWGMNAGCQIKVGSGTGYYASGLYSYCTGGQKVAIKANSKSYTARTLEVGYPSPQFKWGWNPNGQLDKWLKYNKVYKGDTLVFKYPAFKDEVFIVPSLTDYRNCDYSNYISYCNETDGSGAGCYSNPVTSTTYFISGIFSHCMRNNQRIIITPLTPPS
eukprot:TRINITY_DN28910_c0_g1_i1.p2 TRINITY_DN28910_c0_g1~~TRINITY_DN28910_c0_g1_i1.p2  ORF type:complete len:484 (-),score=-8.10 TRINITY_DN28910_c0_g1_i1:381-1832(-)